MYTVYFGPRGRGEVHMGELYSKRFSSMPEALLWAHRVAAKGRTVVRLEGNDGTNLNRSDLACAFRLLAGNGDLLSAQSGRKS